MTRKIDIFDTTLRDGEQSPGASMNTEEKLVIARKLLQLNVDVIEAGFPISSPGDFESVRRIADLAGDHATVCALTRAVEKEIDAAADGTKYLVIHSGSRNLGKQVAELYQKLAVDLNLGKAELFAKKEEIIRTYKEQGRRAEIQDALKELARSFSAKEPTLPEDLCYVYGVYLEDYLHDVEICQRFARRSREKMAEILLERTGMTAISAFHTVHNYIDVQERILRKGAIAAHRDEPVLIPINMRDGSVLAKGKGNPEWNFSAPHGAGRLMSRAKARETLDIEAYK